MARSSAVKIEAIPIFSDRTNEHSGVNTMTPIPARPGFSTQEPSVYTNIEKVLYDVGRRRLDRVAPQVSAALSKVQGNNAFLSPQTLAHRQIFCGSASELESERLRTRKNYGYRDRRSSATVRGSSRSGVGSLTGVQS